MNALKLLLLTIALLSAKALAQDTGLLSPAANPYNNNVTLATNAYASDNQYATFDNGSDIADYGTFSPSIPANATINGIIVRVEGYRSNSRNLAISLSWNNGTNFTTSQNTSFTGTDAAYSFGSSSSNWGRTWTPAEFADGTFRVRLDCSSGTGSVFLDHVQVQVYYTIPPAGLPAEGIPTAVMESLPAGSLIIPMNDLDVDAGQSNENRRGQQSQIKRAYGLVYALLVANVRVKWAFSTSKVHDGADFGATANQVKRRRGDTTITSSFNYKGSAFLIQMQDTAVAGPILRNSTFSRVTVHQVLTDFGTIIPVVYTLSEIPKALIFDNAASQLAALEGVFLEASIPVSAYTSTTTLPNLDNPCFTIAMLPHDEGITTAQVSTLHNYLRDGGNLYAQCAAIDELENTPGYGTTYGHAYTTLSPNPGITRSQTSDGNTYVFADSGAILSYGQVVGTIEQSGISHTPYWRLATGAAYRDGFVDVARTSSNFNVTNLYTKITAKRFDNDPANGWIYYCGGHNHSNSGSYGGNYERIPRMALNAFLTPSARLSCQPLPVELVAFSAAVNGTSVDLKWKTLTEKNNYGFEVQRRTNGSEWAPIGFVEGHGTVSTPQSYSFSDRDAMRFATTLYYRLKQLDRDGSTDFSPVVEVRNDGTVPSARIASISPNPAIGTTAMSYAVSNEGPVSISIYDMMGRERASITRDEYATVGSHTQALDLSGLPAGTYYVLLKTNTTTSTAKLVIGR